MVSESSDPTSMFERSFGEEASETLITLPYKLNQLKKQIQAERVASIKDKVEKNEQKLKIHVSQLISSMAAVDATTGNENGSGKMLSFRIGSSLCNYNGLAQGTGEREYFNSQEVSSSRSIKLPFIEKVPPYTAWIFLDRNQRMAEDQSVVGRRRIYYDPYSSETLICSDSEEEIIEPEEEKHEFSEGEDRIIQIAFDEYGFKEEVSNIVSQFVGGTDSEIQERYNILKEKCEEKDTQKGFGEVDCGRSVFLEKSLATSLDSFDNLFCRRCLVFDCRLHGCSQALIHPSEKPSYSPEHEEHRKPCSDQCYLQLNTFKNLPYGGPLTMGRTSLEANLESPLLTSAEGQRRNGTTGSVLCNGGIPETMVSVASADGNLEIARRDLDSDASNMGMLQQESTESSKVSKRSNFVLEDRKLASDDHQGSSFQKQKISDLNVNQEPSASSGDVIQRTTKGCSNESSQHGLDEIDENGRSKEVPEIVKVVEKNQPFNSAGQVVASGGSDWRVFEKELYLKGIEIFGTNSCRISRNLLSGLKSCAEVYSYMYNDGAAPSQRFAVASNSFSEDKDKEQESSTRSRFFRRRGRTRKLKSSWKSAGHPSSWKRIADGKNPSCKQYTPCGCRTMCGKLCSCLNNGTCCEKYCGCSKSCKNRFRGCHCAKSQCRSRQCPCFAAGRECDPDVCRNCWVSCGDDSLGEPPKRGDGLCGNMRLLLRQQQRILLARSDVAGWGAFIKNPVNKNDYLGEYTGELISHREADKRGKIYDRANSSFLFDLNDQYVLDAYRKGDKLKFANHSSNPNCYAKVMLVAGDHRVGIFAKDRIEASEELFYDYRYGPDQAPAWAQKPEGCRREDSTLSRARAKKHQSH